MNPDRMILVCVIESLVFICYEGIDIFTESFSDATLYYTYEHIDAIFLNCVY
jgi:hypothetical protein